MDGLYYVYNRHNGRTNYLRHNGRTNYLFVDGHVKALRLPETTAPFNMWGGMAHYFYPDLWTVNKDTPEPALVDEANQADKLVN